MFSIAVVSNRKCEKVSWKLNLQLLEKRKKKHLQEKEVEKNHCNGIENPLIFSLETKRFSKKTLRKRVRENKIPINRGVS